MFEDVKNEIHDWKYSPRFMFQTLIKRWKTNIKGKMVLYLSCSIQGKGWFLSLSFKYLNSLLVNTIPLWTVSWNYWTLALNGKTWKIHWDFYFIERERERERHTIHFLVIFYFILFFVDSFHVFNKKVRLNFIIFGISNKISKY